MSAQLIISDKVIELDERVTYNFQVSDIAEISRSKSNYTSSFKIPRTSDNVKFFEGLGVPADNSGYPYRITEVALMDDYVPLLKGTLVFMRTDRLNYNVTVISGSYDFFTELGDTNFSDIGVVEIEHLKTPNNVAARLEGSFPGDYTYGFAWFGGASHFIKEINGGNVTLVNTDCMIPAVSAKYLWDKVFTAVPQFTFTGDFYNSVDFNSLYLTFPYDEPASEQASNDAASAKRGAYEWANVPPNTQPDNSLLPPWSEPENDPEYAVFSGNDIIPVKYGMYAIGVPDFLGYADMIGSDGTSRLFVNIKVNSSVIATLEADFDIQDGEDIPANRPTVYQVMNTGDILSFDIIRDPNQNFQFEANVRLTNISIEITAFDPPKIGSTLRASDFVKEIMWRYGLISVVDNNNIDFVHIGNVIDSAVILDWSDKYISRTEEEYTLGYSQSNWLRHKYEKDGDDYFDRNIVSNNQNLSPNKTVVQSNFYAASENKNRFNTGFGNISLREFRTFDPDDDSYKLLDRHYFVRVESDNVGYWVGSKTVGGDFQEVPLPPEIINTHYYSFDDLDFETNPYWDALDRILDRTRVHRIELLLAPVDINQLDIAKKYYFEQEQAYYMLNKLQYRKGEPAKGEFVKIR